MTTEAAPKPHGQASGPAAASPAGATGSNPGEAAAGALSRAWADNVISAWLGRHEFALRRLHSLSGILFGGYVIVHLVISATLTQGLGAEGTRTVYQIQVDRKGAIPFAGMLVLVFVLLPILFHSIYGIVMLASARPNVDRYGYPKNWAWLLQRITAIVLVLFIAFHYLAMKGAFGGNFGRMLSFVAVDHATQSVVNHVHAAWWVGWFLYPLGILAAAYHTAYGFWTAGITWGLTISSRAQRVWLRACMGLCLLLLICGFAALGAALSGDPTDEPLVGRAAQAEPREGEPAAQPGQFEAGETGPESTQPSDVDQAEDEASVVGAPESTLR